MKRIRRLPLSSKTLTFLKQRTAKVGTAADPSAEAKRLWERKGKAFEEIRQALKAMASGIERCMYCEDSAGTDIEHFWPKTDYPLLAFDWDNYLIACSGCNSNYKRTQFPRDPQDLPLLLNPVEEEPLDHLAFSPSTGRYEPTTPKGTASEEVYGLNRDTLTRGRQSAWTVLQELLTLYAQHKSGDPAKAGRIEAAVRTYPFAGVLAALLHIAAGPGATALVDAGSLRALHDNPEIRGWV
jgi:uncharacterized protein (TIGR02646 family)